MKRGYTLIELLVTIAIIIVIVSFVCSAVGKSWRNSKDNSLCMNNVKQLCIATAMFADQKNRFPTDVEVRGNNSHYFFKELPLATWKCPKNKNILQESYIFLASGPLTSRYYSNLSHYANSNMWGDTLPIHDGTRVVGNFQAAVYFQRPFQ